MKPCEDIIRAATPEVSEEKGMFDFMKPLLCLN
jgi:hypothetical protein